MKGNQKRKENLPKAYRNAVIQPKTLNKEARTVEVIWTKGARVLRRSFFGDFYEELGLEDKEVRMNRLESGSAPVLDNHGFTDKGGVRSTIGVVEDAELISGKEGRATLRFSKRADVEEIFQDIEDRILQNISVGYNTYKAEETGEDNGIPVFRAIDWEPVEISVVPAGADPGARIRSESEETVSCEFIRKTVEDDSEKNSDPDNEGVAQPDNLRQTGAVGDSIMDKNKPGETQTQEQIDNARAEAKTQEKTRQKEIRSVVSSVKLDPKLAEKYIDEDKTVDEVRALVIDELAKKDASPENETRSAHSGAVVGEDLARKGRIEGMTNALLHRHRPNDEQIVHSGRTITMKGTKITDAGRDYAYLSLIDMARRCLEAKGVRTGEYPPHMIADMALNNVRMGGLHSTSDFPEILANVVNKTLRDGYQSAPQTFRPFTREVFVNDFKEISRVNLGEGEKLERVPEGGEVKRGTMSEAAEKYRVDEYAKIVAISRKVIVNDDLDAFALVPERMGRRAADLESDLVWEIFKLNAALADGFALFSAQHGNLSTVPAAPSETGLSEGRKLMRRQKGLDGQEIALVPTWLFVPPEHETVAEKLVAAIVPDSSTNVSPFSSAGRTPLRLDVEPRLETGTGGSTAAWFLTADKGQVDMIELARLTDTNGPQTMTREGFDVHGVEVKVMHDVGAKAIDHRGLFKNAGA